ncbi:hypothetical protein V8C86DRAFT_3136054 [Haematococcus lacustris]
MIWDAYLQCTSQGHAGRHVEYLRRAGVLSAYPAGIAREVTEPGPRTDHTGPCLAHLVDLRIPPADLLACIDSKPYLRRSITRVYFVAGAAAGAGQTCSEELNSKTSHICGASTAQRQQQQHSQQEGHLGKQQQPRPSLDSACHSRQALVAAVVAAGAPEGSTLRLCAFPKSLEAHLGEQLPLSFQLDPHTFTHVLMAVELGSSPGQPSGAVGQPGQQVEVRWGMVPAQWLFRLQHDEPPRFPAAVAQGGGQSSEPSGSARLQAVNKLDEALDVSGAGCGAQPGPAVWPEGQRGGQAGGAQLLGQAIDVGAAPGSWTAYLARRCRRVVAVDPADLAPEVLALPNVHHLRMNSTQPGITQALQHLLSSEPEGGDPAGLAAGGLADLLVCDMNSHPLQSCKVVQDLLHLLRPGGRVVLTLKLKGTGRDRSRVVQQLDDYFKAELVGAQCIWLLANTKYEATYLATRAGGDTQLEEEADDVSQQQWGTRKQLVVIFGTLALAHEARRKVVEGPNSGKPTDRLPGKVVTVDEYCTSQPGASGSRRQFGASCGAPGSITPPLGTATPINIQQAGEATWRPVELCWWPHRAGAVAQGKEYPASGFTRLHNRAPKAQAQQPVAQ